jgi:multidrug efflux system outer membrane protein
MRKLLIFPALLLLSSCGIIGKKYETPSTEKIVQKDFNFNKVEQPVSKIEDAEPVVEWWKNFQDAELTALVEKALKHNHDIKIAKANLQAARLFIDESELGYFPKVTSSANYSDHMLSQEGNIFNPASRRNKSYEAGFDATWELDLFGQATAQVEKAEAEAGASAAQLRGAYVSVAAEVARAYIELRGAQARLDIAEKNAKTQKKTYDLTKDLLEAGSGNQLDIERAQANLQLTKSTIPTLQALTNSSLNRLAVLTGKAPNSLQKSLQEIKPIPSIPASVNIGKPMDLIKRRPDVMQADSDFARSIAQYNIKVADLYPSVNLNGNIGFVASTFANLGSAGTSTLLLAPTLNWAAFNLRQVDKQIDQAEAISQAQLANFEKTVLGALEEVDTALVNFGREEQSRANLLRAAKASAKAEELAQERYDAGLDSFIDKLDAERTLLQAQDNLAQSETGVALNLIAVYKALGGGWEVAQGKDVEE